MTDTPMKTHPIPPASGDLEAVALPSLDEVKAAIKETEYKYFGDYGMSPEQCDAVDVLVRAAKAHLRPADPAIRDSRTTEIPAVVGEGEPVAWQSCGPNGFWAHDEAGHDPVVRRGLEINGLRFRPLYAAPASQDALIARVRTGLSDIKDAADSFCDCSGDEVAGQVRIRIDALIADLNAGAGT